MGEEADADWQDGLVEWGIEDAEKSLKEQCIQTRNGVPFRKQKKRRPAPSLDDLERDEGDLEDRSH